MGPLAVVNGLSGPIAWLERFNDGWGEVFNIDVNLYQACCSFSIPCYWFCKTLHYLKKGIQNWWSPWIVSPRDSLTMKYRHCTMKSSCFDWSDNKLDEELRDKYFKKIIKFKNKRKYKKKDKKKKKKTV